VRLFDIRMPVLDGVEATRLLAGPGVEDPVAVVVITTFDLDEYVHGALLAGATGFLLKDAGPELLGGQIRPRRGLIVALAVRGSGMLGSEVRKVGSGRAGSRRDRERRLRSRYARTWPVYPGVSYRSA
jgi:DNA-binding NarL/FixJ family response regulator